MDPHTLARAVEMTEGLFTRFLSGFDDTSRTTQAPGVPNHAIWILGHCGLTMHRVAHLLDGAPLPDSDYIIGDGTSGTPDLFDTATVCKDSTPRDEPDAYPLLARGLDAYTAAIRRLASAVRGSSTESLQQPIEWHGARLTHGELVLRVCFHNGCHAGQLTDLRRVLGLPMVIPSP